MTFILPLFRITNYLCIMNLIVDIGNTSVKLAVYKSGSVVSFFRISDLSCEDIESKLKGYKIERAIISSVKDFNPFLSELLFSNIPFVHILTHKSKLPFKIGYETPETLGTDRIAAVAGAYSKFPESEILVIDAGSAIKFDYISSGLYLGGNISPGINMRFRALNSFTDKLPLVSITDKYETPGRNTTGAIAAGVITGVTYEINEYIRTFEKKHSDFKIILTGGDSDYLKNKINHQITYMPDIVTDGLNNILDYNAT
jgi:type III pantothenate kinase